jgi:hypothetical protein
MAYTSILGPSRARTDSPSPGLPDIPLLHLPYVNVDVVQGWMEGGHLLCPLPQLTAAAGSYDYLFF